MKSRLLLLFPLLLLGLLSCSNNQSSNTMSTSNKQSQLIDEDEAIAISFKEALSFDYLKSIDRQKVKINGYMATSSPVDGSFIFLVNLPYQSCPFCKPNTSTLSNTIEAYPKKGRIFSYTESAIKVVGTLIVADSVDQFFIDKYGYEFNFKITEAEYTIIDESELSGEVTFWNQMANSNIINDVYSMLEYINFTVKWPTYFVNSYVDIDGNTIPGFYLYAGDAVKFIMNDGAQYNYGYKSDYFDLLVNKCKNLSEDKLAGLIEIIRDGETLANEGVKALQDKDYTYQEQYVPKFDTTDYIFKLNKETEFNTEMDALIDRFNNWFTSFIENMEM